MNIFGHYIVGIGLVIFFVLVIIIWLIIPLLIAKAAKERGRSFGGFLFLSILFSPIIGGLVLLLMGRNEDEVKRMKLESGTSKNCPYCANVIDSNARICMFCHKELNNFLLNFSSNQNNTKEDKRNRLEKILQNIDVDINIKTFQNYIVNNPEEINEIYKTLIINGKMNMNTHIKNLISL